MIETNNQPFYKVALLCLGVFGMLAALFAGLITLTSNASFWVVFAWIMAAVVVLMAIFFFYEYVLVRLAIKDFVGYLLITGGVGAIIVAVICGVFAGVDYTVWGGALGLLRLS